METIKIEENSLKLKLLALKSFESKWDFYLKTQLLAESPYEVLKSLSLRSFQPRYLTQDPLLTDNRKSHYRRSLKPSIYFDQNPGQIKLILVSPSAKSLDTLKMFGKALYRPKFEFPYRGVETICTPLLMPKGIFPQDFPWRYEKKRDLMSFWAHFYPCEEYFQKFGTLWYLHFLKEFIERGDEEEEEQFEFLNLVINSLDKDCPSFSEFCRLITKNLEERSIENEEMFQRRLVKLDEYIVTHHSNLKPKEILIIADAHFLEAYATFRQTIAPIYPKSTQNCVAQATCPEDQNNHMSLTAHNSRQSQRDIDNSTRTTTLRANKEICRRKGDLMMIERTLQHF